MLYRRRFRFLCRHRKTPEQDLDKYGDGMAGPLTKRTQTHVEKIYLLWVCILFLSNKRKIQKYVFALKLPYLLTFMACCLFQNEKKVF